MAETMATSIREGNILEFRALTVTPRIFDQIRKVEGEGVNVVGWVNADNTEYFLGKLGNTLVKVYRTDMCNQIALQIGLEKAREEAKALGIGISQYVNTKLDQYRDSLPQIFIK